MFYAFQKELDFLRQLRDYMNYEEGKKALDVAIMAIRIIRGEPTDEEMKERHLTIGEWKKELQK